MKVIVRTTEDYRLEAETLGQAKFIESQIAIAKQSGNLNFGTRIIADDPYVKLRCTKNLRCILTYRDFDVLGETIRCYVALRLVTHDKYEEFSNYKDASAQAAFSRIRDLDWDDIRRSIEDASVEIEDAIELKNLTNCEYAFINQTSGLLSEFVSSPVYESDFWMSDIASLSDEDKHLVRDAINAWMSAHQYETHAIGRTASGVEGKSILIAVFRTEGFQNLFLLNFGNLAELDAFISENLPNADDTSLDDLCRLCVRSYPYSLISTDAALWIQKEKSSATNFMISSAERELLSKNPVYPLCLSGRAGSGKSTLLRYLFADCMCRYLASGNDLLPPLFISHSKNHAEKAKTMCENLFTNDFRNSRYLKESGIDYESSLKPHFSKSCRAFADFALECAHKIADGEDSPNSFSPAKRMSFGEFCREWKLKFKGVSGAEENYGPELSWHVIRTFIKGWDACKELGIEEFSAIGSANHPYVSNSEFANVYENVWGWYRKLLKNRNMWDEQDVIRFCLDSMNDQPEMFGALYCDEIQEFTRIEREFLFSCSSFTRRKISTEAELSRIPFVFAGDEIQSVNLTGFCWDGLRSHLADTFKQMIGDLFEPKPPEPVELSDNFRSAPAIVRLANRIHLLRLTRTGGACRYEPQHPHALSVNASESICCLDPNDGLVWKKLSEANALVIVPCPDGQKMSTYIKSSPIADKIDFDGNGNAKGITLLSVHEAKGLQHPCVALYGFEMKSGALGLDSLLDWFRHPSADPGQDIAVRRMLTAAYVSATRAQRQLYILDECWKDNSIWSGFYDYRSTECRQKLEELDAHMFERAKWQCDSRLLGYITEGSYDCIGIEGTSCSPEQARAIESAALAEQKSRGMHNASSIYARLGMKTDEARCEAYASRFSNRHLLAAQRFASLGMSKEALEDYLTEISNKQDKRLFAEIAKLSGLDCIEYEFAKEASTVSCSAKNVCILLENFIDAWEVSERRESLLERSKAWHAAFSAIFKNLAECGPFDKTEVSRLVRLVTKLHKISDDQFKFDLVSVAKIASLSECDEETVATWDLIGNGAKRPREYYCAQCRLIPYPDNLVYREHTGAEWFDAVIKDCEEHDIHSACGAIHELGETPKLSDKAEEGGHQSCYDIESLSEQQRKIIGKAFYYAGNSEEQKYGLSMLLEYVQSKSEADKMLSDAVSKKFFVLPAKCFSSLFSYRFSDRPEKLDPDIFEDEGLAELARSLNLIRSWGEQNFADRLNKAINVASASCDVFKSTFGDCLVSARSGLLLYEAGRIMERRNDYLSASRFYEWVVENIVSDVEPRLDNYFKKRLIYCLETASYSQRAFIPGLWALGHERRLALGIDPVENILKEPAYPSWQPLYFEVLSCDPSQKKNNHSSPNISKGATVSKKSKVRKYKGNQNDKISEKAVSFAQNMLSKRKDPVTLALQKQRDAQIESELSDQTSEVPAVFADPAKKADDQRDELARGTSGDSGNAEQKDISFGNMKDFMRSVGRRQSTQYMTMLRKAGNQNVSLGSLFQTNSSSGSVPADIGGSALGNDDAHDECSAAEIESQKAAERLKKEKEQAERAQKAAEREEKKRLKRERAEENKRKMAEEAAAKKQRKMESQLRYLEKKAAEKTESAKLDAMMAAEEEKRKQQQAEEHAANVRRVEEARLENEKNRAEKAAKKKADAEKDKLPKSPCDAKTVSIAADGQSVLGEQNEKIDALPQATCEAEIARKEETPASEKSEISEQTHDEEVKAAPQASDGQKGIIPDAGNAESAKTAEHANNQAGETFAQQNNQERNLAGSANMSASVGHSSAEGKAKPGEKLFELDVEGYKLRYHPKNGELSVLYLSDDADLFYKLKRGIEAPGNDFMVDPDGTMTRTDTGEIVPISVTCTFDSVCVTLRASGVQIYFPYDNQGSQS